MILHSILASFHPSSIGGRWAASIQGVLLANLVFSSSSIVAHSNHFPEGTSAVLSGQRDPTSRRGEGKWFTNEWATSEK